MNDVSTLKVICILISCLFSAIIGSDNPGFLVNQNGKLIKYL